MTNIKDHTQTTPEDKKQSVCLRITRDLHDRLIEQAEREHRSLNQHCAYLLKQASDEVIEISSPASTPAGSNRG